MGRGLSEPWAQVALSPLSEPFSRQLLFSPLVEALSPLSEPFSRQLLFSPLVDSAQFFYLFFIYLPPTPCSSIEWRCLSSGHQALEEHLCL